MTLVVGEPIDSATTDPRLDRSARMELTRRRMHELITSGAAADSPPRSRAS